MSVLGMIVSGGVIPVDPKPNCGISSGRRPLRWSGDEVARHLYCVVFFRFVEPCFLSTVTEVDRGLGLGELTFLQLSTTYAPAVAGRSVGYVFPRNSQYAGLTLSRNPDISPLAQVLLGSSAHSFGGSSEILAYE